jgi:hypothetical protein
MEALHDQELQATKDIIMSLQLQQLLTMQIRKKTKTKAKKCKNATPTSKTNPGQKNKKHKKHNKKLEEFYKRLTKRRR